MISLRVAAPVHVAHNLVGLPAHMLQGSVRMRSGPTIRPHLGQECVGSPGQRGGDMARGYFEG